MPKKYIYLIVTYVAMQFSIFLVLPFRDLITDMETFSTWWSVITFALALVVSFIILKGEMKEFFDLEHKRIGNIILWSVLGFFLVMIGQYASILIETFVFGIKPGSENTMDLMNVARQMPIFIIIISVLGPILEELVFRKAIFGTLYKKMNFFFAAIISGLIFATVHMDFSHLLTYTAIGMIFAFLYVETKRIIVPIIAHMSINTFAVIGQLSLDSEQIEQQMKQLEELMTIIIGG
ncbi:CPBP family intramembrane metalloprotease [Gracilibacillus caseinilyticus]|uniref:CPBP family intramembrane metalloprotease n=1 Tax=Gracilibacillus caseinilyticus TaxID=2932256 RepID=A0ABY4EXW1_9BACI|nr:type II CAAX endopeptidase family protein [Gracilibacillus caseinilyticus]UOQ49093.1 CPBP family intramembrane metalloprotease [Gracilibacillus caseinilyticus]